MTTIAYRDGILAADTMVQGSQMNCGAVTKIAQHENTFTMGGACGSAEACQLFRQWILDGAVPPCPTLGDDADGLLIDGAGNTFFVGPKGVMVPFKAKFVAIGSGEKFAMAAMHMGARAIEAVEVAIALDLHSAGPIDHFILPDTYPVNLTRKPSGVVV